MPLRSLCAMIDRPRNPFGTDLAEMDGDLQFLREQFDDLGYVRGYAAPWESDSPRRDEQDRKQFELFVRKMHAKGYLRYLEATDGRQHRRCIMCGKPLKYTEERVCDSHR